MHRWLGDGILVTVVLVASLCIVAEPFYMDSLRVILHIFFAGLTLLSIVAKVLIARRFRSYLNYARPLGIVLIFLIFGVSYTSAFAYLFHL